jgi:hypothetical protein
MRRTLLAVAMLAAGTSASLADVNIQRRFVGVRVGGGGVTVRAPGVGVDVGRGGVGVRAPGVGVDVGRGGVGVRTPGVGVDVPRRGVVVESNARSAPSVLPPEGVPLEIAPQGQPVPMLKADRSASAEPMTIHQFAAAIKPAQGSYEVVLIHPYTNCPVKVCFELPEGCPRVRVCGCLRRCVEFDYGNCGIDLWFYRDGRVSVKPW